jgi:hypothetical protein
VRFDVDPLYFLAQWLGGSRQNFQFRPLHVHVNQVNPIQGTKQSTETHCLHLSGSSDCLPVRTNWITDAKANSPVFGGHSGLDKAAVSNLPRYLASSLQPLEMGGFCLDSY